MAYDNSQNEYPVPIDPSSRKISSLLPRFYRSDSNKKFVHATLEQLLQPGTVKKVNGFIGRQDSKATTADDIFVQTSTTDRQNYQLEPSAIIKDDLNNVVFNKDYLDHINHISVLGGITNNHRRLNKQEFYSWNPLIDWDKFVNFQQYYWLPYGPSSIPVYGQQKTIQSEYTVSLVDEGDNFAYIFNPDGLTRNPVLKLYRGQTYKFNVTTPNQAFSIKTQRIGGTLSRYTQGVSVDDSGATAVESGILIFEIPLDAPNVLFYVSENDVNIGGVLQIQNIEDNTEIDVDTEILGKKTYTMGNGYPLSNGMKVNFVGEVTPSQYATGYWYVEGVGDKIRLVSADDLEIVSGYSEQRSVLFDDTAFDELPFDDATAFAGDQDYITVNRASPDRNPWSRYNRWFHQSIIDIASTVNGTTADLDQSARAKRPIIEFTAGIKLYNFGTKAKKNIDLIDTFTTDVFSTIEGSLGYNVDGVSLADGHRLLVTADTDIRVVGRIFQVKFIEVQFGLGRQKQITLIEVDDTEPQQDQTVLVKLGTNQGKMYWFDGTVWKLGQEKISINQDVLFDIFDNDEVGISDINKYEGSTFVGTKVFSYQRGTGIDDSILKFPLTYRNINNIGDVVFNFNYTTDTFSYKQAAELITVNVSKNYLKIVLDDTVTYANGWITNYYDDFQRVIRIYKGQEQTNNFNVDVYDDITNLADLKINVYINGIRLPDTQYAIEDGIKFKYVVLNVSADINDVIVIKTLATQAKNINGYYELPVSLQNNPLNENVNNFTLGQVNDHVDSIINNLTNFQGIFPGNNNLRDLGLIAQYGTRFIQHSGPLTNSLYHIGSRTSNAVNAIDTARDDYGKFKRNFLLAAENLGIDTDPRDFVDLILNEINKSKSNTEKYYLSDMVPHTGLQNYQFTVLDSDISTYPLSFNFDMSTLSNHAVLIYLNGEQLIFARDYEFNSEGFVNILTSLAEGDTIDIAEYDTTDGCFIPATPSKLGLYPKFVPEIYIDNTYLESTLVIQGHDGSITLAFNDYRDNLILELEKRIYNNIKVNYDSEIVDIYDIIPGYSRATEYSRQEFLDILSGSFYRWASLVDNNIVVNDFFDRLDPFTFNYNQNKLPNGEDSPGFWRGIYRYLLDTDRPHTHPWECLGFSIEPNWWQSVYGPRPYTSDNLILWEDLQNGFVREPNKPVITREKFVRPGLLSRIPADQYGNLTSPLLSNSIYGFIQVDANNDFVFGDGAPTETAWSRSSYYAFAVMQTALLMYPNKILGLYLDRSRTVKNLTGQFVYADTNLRIKFKDIVLPATVQSTTRTYTAGIINWIVDLQTGVNVEIYNSYKYDLKNITCGLTSKLGGFTSKEKFRLLLDSKSPSSTSNVFVPDENYDIFLNTNSPIQKINYSGVVIQKSVDGFEVRGYNFDDPYFDYYQPQGDGRVVNIGGISELFLNWASGQVYRIQTIVRQNNQYYKCTVSHTSTDSFDQTKFTRLSALPIIGGRDIAIKKSFANSITRVPYGTKFTEYQDVVDFLIGYGKRLETLGFIFDSFNTALNTITNWETSAKEFAFWLTQNWTVGTVLCLSPSALKISLRTELAQINNIFDIFYPYSILQSDGQPLAADFINTNREDNVYSLTPKNTVQGIYGASFYLIQKEHVLLLDNVTQFNDVIYDLQPGYRQERIKVLGYLSNNWDGGFNIPGFIYDEAKVEVWKPWTDYYLGDIVQYKQYYYAAKKFTPGSLEFNNDNWNILKDKPQKGLLPNWDYKAEQFNDFYDLNTDNFDTNQQKVAQHLIGYQKRTYLENIIKDDVSQYKFYQGMIIEKGTENVFNKLFDVLSAANQESLTLDEEWAVRVGQYGGSAAYEEIEFTLNEEQFKINPQALELTNNTSVDNIDFVIRQTINDIYLKPVNFTYDFWPTLTTSSKLLRNAGYVRYNDVALNVDSLEDLLLLGNSTSVTLKEGDYVWTVFDGIDWNVYRYTKIVNNVEVIETTTTTVQLDFSKLTDLVVGDIIGIANTVSLNGFYKIVQIVGRKITLTNTNKGTHDAGDSSQILVYKFVSARLETNIDDANDRLPENLKRNELLWTDNNNKWTVWQNNSVFSIDQMDQSFPVAQQKFGTSFSIDDAANTMAVSSALQSVFIFAKNPEGNWIQKQTIQELQNLSAVGNRFGASVTLSKDARWLFIGAPTATDVKTKFVGNLQFPQSYPQGAIVQSGLSHWRAMYNLGADSAVITEFLDDWEPARLIEAELSGTGSGLTNQGMVYIYQRDDAGNYILNHTIVSPYPVQSELFGSKIKITENNGEYLAAISSPGVNANQGRLYFFRYGDVSVDSGFEWHMDYNRAYRGYHNPGYEYNVGDIVYYNFKIYQAIAQVPTDPFENNPSLWQEIDNTNIQCFVPKLITTLDIDEQVINDGSTTLLQSENVESVFAGDKFGHEFDLSADGSTLVVSAPHSDNINYDGYKGPYRSDMAYFINEIVIYNGQYWQFTGPYGEEGDSTAIEDSTKIFTAGTFDYDKWTPLDLTAIDKGKVFVYTYTEDTFQLIDTLSSRDFNIDQQCRFGESVSLTRSGSKLAVGSILYDDHTSDQGAVFVFNYNNTLNRFDTLQIIKKKYAEVAEQFGSTVRFFDEDKSLAIFAKRGDSSLTITFDITLATPTTFDGNNLLLTDTFVDSGRIDIYDKYLNNYVYGESLKTYLEVQDDGYGSAIETSRYNVVVSAPQATYNNLSSAGAIWLYNRPGTSYSWSILHQQAEYVDIDKIKKLYFYNADTNQLISYIDTIDPIRGRIAGVADQEIKYKTYYDPATYSTGIDSVIVDDGANWTDKFVGTLWWDLNRAKFLDHYDSDVSYRNTTWNTLYETASIDVYEWVKSKFSPARWNALADTEEGLAQGISGQAKYGDNVVSTKRRYDTQTKNFKINYYFWVKNKTTIPANIEGRTLSAAAVSRLIADPKSQNYKFVAFGSANSIHLFNCKNLLSADSVKLNIQYWLVPNDTVNIHSQWKLIRQDADCIVPAAIENKWIDSLVGKDKNDRLVPDINLPIKKKYGIEFRPRQSMFVYRYEALKQVIERTNSILQNLLVVDDFDLTDLQQTENIPAASRGVYDRVLDTDAEIRFISTNGLRSARLTPTIVDGKIISATVVDSGIGYVNAPYVKVLGVGVDASLKTTLDTQGRVTGVTVLNSGMGYIASTTLLVRPYSVLITSDSQALNRWSIYAYDTGSLIWSRVKSQSYDVTNFWNYIDWFATGYNQFTQIDYSVNYTYEIPLIQSNIGETVKVFNVGSGGWLLLEKYAQVNSQDYTQSYKVVGRQRGTIEFSSSLYKLTNSLLTFDGGLYDNDSYDNSATIELRIILETLKNKIFVDNYRQYWLDLLFVGFRYALSEQSYLDWLMKTSFIKATHNAGELKQKVNYNNDNLENYEDYINEVKPYRTKVREYVSAYSKIDAAPSMISDFDLPQVYNSNGKIEPINVRYIDNTVVYNSPQVLEYPWKNWYDNVGFKIKSIEIVNGGSGYVIPPVVRITGNGTGASALAFIANGKVNRIKIVNPGTGYLSAPTLILDGGLAENGIAAQAVAIIESEVVRSMHVSIKFDRTSKNYYITELTETETFTGSGSLKQFILKWPADVKVGKSSVTVDGQEILRENYTISKKSSVSRGYTAYYSVLTLDEAPANGATVSITYYKDVTLLSAADRINFFYNPTTGQLGNDLGQLLTGVDYGGVNVTGLGFGSGAGWDALPWFSDQWDGFDAAFDDYVVTVGDSTYLYYLPYIPELGQEINVYVNGLRIDDPYFALYDGSTVQPNGRKLPQDWSVMTTIIGTGVTNNSVYPDKFEINLPNLTDPYPLNINDGDKIIFRKSTSDGSFLPNENEYDTILQGGNLAYTTATGIAPDDIILDGDNFVTPDTSHGPEELVPGQILDAVAIKVYAMSRDGSAKIKWNNYKGDGANVNFSIKQYANSKQAIVVLVNGIIKEQSIDYTVDWQNSNIVFAVPPVLDSDVAVSSFSFNGDGILDLDYFVGDGSTIEFITNASWTAGATSIVLVNGELLNYDLFQTDITYQSAYRVGIRFVTPPPSGSIVNYLIQRQFFSDDSTELQKTSVVKSETIVTDGSTTVYSLTNIVGFNDIYENNVIVRTGQTILQSSSAEYFTLASNNLIYSLPQHKFAPYSFAPINLKVYLNGVQLLVGSEYIFDFSTVSVVLTSSKYIDNGKLIVVIDTAAEYKMTANTIQFVNTVWPAGTEFEIISFYNHDVMDIQRKSDIITSAISLTVGTVDYFTFRNKERGLFVLDRVTVSDDFIWVIKNGSLLTHSIDWKLLADHRTIEVKDVLPNDTLSVIGYNPIAVTEQYSYMQFKDMLNRTHYKRLNKNKQTFIVNDLYQTDIGITVDDASVLDDPNPEGNLPGIVYINGERIEYFAKTGNVLSRLRRGTLGTGVPTVHRSGTDIINIGISETIPYKDELIIETFVSTDSSNVLYTNFVPEVTSSTIDDGSTVYTPWYRNTIPSNFGQCDQVEVFVAGYRLKKVPYKLHNITVHSESPEGDIQYESEFSVDGETSTVRLTTPPPDDTKIVVVKKVGKMWSDLDTSLVDSTNNIANFIKSAPGVWPL